MRKVPPAFVPDREPLVHAGWPGTLLRAFP